MTVLVILLLLLPGIEAADTSTLTSDDSAFLSDLQNTGIPMLYQIPASLKTAFFDGEKNSIAAVSKKQGEDLDTFKAKISRYNLSPKVTVLRDAFLKTTERYKQDLNKSATLIKTCGSCVAEINQIYPDMTAQATWNTYKLVAFYQENHISLDSFKNSALAAVQKYGASGPVQ